MTDRNYDSRSTDWITVGVTPLPPGWINVYRDDDGGYLTEPAPALLLEEATTCTHYWREDGMPVKRTEEIERQTRVVFATAGENTGELVVAGDARNYAYSTTEAEHALRMLELDAAERTES